MKVGPMHAQLDAGNMPKSKRVEMSADEQLRRRVVQMLQRTGYPHLGKVEVGVHEKLAVLKGRVPSYYVKQVAQCAAMAVPGVESLQNDLTVDWDVE